MPTRLSEHLGVPASELEDAGVFNGFIDLDSKLHVDPHLMSQSSVPEMRDGYDALRQHFAEIIRIIDKIVQPGDLFWGESIRRLTFPEAAEASLGYANTSNRGTGIGPELAEQLLRTAIELVRAGVRDPEIFELVGLIRNNVGADRISDMAIAIARDNFYSYTERVCEEIGCDVAEFQIGDSVRRLPVHPDTERPLILVPRDVLRDLPMALDWESVHYVCAYNEASREKANDLIGMTWKEAIKERTKDEIRGGVIEIPAALLDLIQQYRDRQAEPYDFERDPLGETRWFDLSQEVADSFPLQLATPDVWTVDAAVAIVRDVLKHLRDLVEKNGLWELIHDRRERHAQRLVYGIAKRFLEDNGLDISPEVNAGSGPVDFKISVGPGIKILVEVKLSSNSHLRHGYEVQLPTYSEAESSDHDFFLVFLVGNVTPSLDSVRAQHSQAVRDGTRSPELFEIDARPKEPASKRRNN